MQKSLDLKLARLRQNQDCGEFILADAKDADMAFGLRATGQVRQGSSADPRPRSLEEYRECMREVTRQGLVDIMLMSCSSSEVLTIQDRLFDESAVTPAVRANDSTDIWLGGSGGYTTQPSRPFRSATIDHIQCGRLDCNEKDRSQGADLALYSVTLNNDAELDRQTLSEFAAFREEAERKRLRYFLEVFAPNACREPHPAVLADYLNDSIARMLAGVPRIARPLFLKIPYLGPRAMEALVSYDPTLIVGILGGPAGTTHDAFHMLAEARDSGARAALFGRKILQAEDQLLFIEILYEVAHRQTAAREAVVRYHDGLQKRGITPRRSLEDDLELTQFAH